MNLPISSSAPSGYVISQRTIASHNQGAMSQGPKNTSNSQMIVTAHHQNSAPHQQGAHGIQFAQSVTSLPGLVQQPQTMMQTVSANGFQYTQPLPMLQQGQILQSVYHQGGQPQMLISSQGNFALQQPIGQSLAMMQSPGQKVQQSIPIQPGKQMVAGSAQQMMTAMQPQTMTLNSTQKIQVVNHKQQTSVAGTTRNPMAMGGQSHSSSPVTGQAQASTTIAMTGPTQSGQITVSSSNTHPQFVNPQNANGALLINMLPQAGMIASQQDMSQQSPSQQHQQQQQQQHQQPIEVSVAHAQQLLGSNNNQTVNLGQSQIPLQAFNPFTNGLSWTSGQLQGGQVLQSPIFIRNPSDGTLYIHNPAPSNQQQQQQQQQQPSSIAQPITLQTRSSMSTPPTGVSGTMNVSANVQPATSTMSQPISQPQLTTSSQAQLPTGVAMTPPAANNNAVPTTTLSNETNAASSGSNTPSAASAPTKETPRSTPGPWNHPQPFRISRPPAPIQPVGLKVTMMPRGVRGIIPRPPRHTTINMPEQAKHKAAETKPLEGSASRCAAYDFSEESSDSTPPLSKFLLKTIKPSAAEPPQDAAPIERAEKPPVATISPLESVKKPVVAAIPAAGIPDTSEKSGSTSPAIAATFPSEDSDLPESHEEASEILTHIVEGFVIREGPVPFPVTRTALLNEILAREQMVMQNIKERKRKHESAVAASHARMPGNYNRNTCIDNTEKDSQSKGSTTLTAEPSEAARLTSVNNRTGHNATRTMVKIEHQVGSPRIEPRSKSQNAATKNRGAELNGDDDNANIASVIDNPMDSKNLGLNIAAAAKFSQSAEHVAASIERVAKNETCLETNATRKSGQSGEYRDAQKDSHSYIGGTVERASFSSEVAAKEAQGKEKNQRDPPATRQVSGQQVTNSPIEKKAEEPSKEAPSAAEQVDSFSTKNPLTWTVQEVFEFIKTIPGCAMYAEEFRNQEIDGEAMLFLKVEHLMTRLSIKLGPAAKICARLKQLQAEVSA